MARGVPHDDTIKAAVLAELALGSTVNAVARQFGLSNSTVIAWRDAHHVQLVQPEKRDELGARIAEYLDTGLQALTAQARVAGDPTYIRSQPAGELAILHGVLSDKLVRILSALQPSSEADRPDPYPA